MLTHTLIDTFVATAQQRHLFQGREFSGLRLLQKLSLRRHHNDWTGLNSLFPKFDSNRLDSQEQRFRLKHHSTTPAKRFVINLPVGLICKITQIMHSQLHKTLTDGAADNSFPEWPGKKSGKDRDYVYPHGVSHRQLCLCCFYQTCWRINHYQPGFHIHFFQQRTHHRHQAALTMLCDL
jgi:hypothetical protein